ncbi:hypothetical protein CsSME_00038916 [Camellia sinensis var. sinensis]
MDTYVYSKSSVLLGKCGLSYWGAPLGDSTGKDLMNRLRNGNANEQQPNGILDEIDDTAIKFHCVRKK